MEQYQFPVQDQVFHNTIEHLLMLEPGEPNSEWRTNWSAKMELLYLKESGFNWDDIESTLKGRFNMRRRSSWYEKHRKIAIEVEAMGKAAAAEKDGEVDRLASTAYYCGIDEISDLQLQIDYSQIWERMANSMKAYGLKGWTAEKVRFAWNNGISRRYPDITISGTSWSEDLAASVSEGKARLLPKE